MEFINLPFVQMGENGVIVSTWTPEDLPLYHEATALGRSYFEQLLPLIEDNGVLLSRVIEGQVKRGRWGGVETGFHAALTEHLI